MVPHMARAFAVPNDTLVYIVQLWANNSEKKSGVIKMNKIGPSRN